MSRKLFILVILFFASAPVFAQSVDTAWVRRYDGPAGDRDDALAVALDDSGNVYVTGYSWASIGDSLTHPDYATIKYNASGSELWVERYDGTGNSGDYAYAIVTDDSGNVYVTGTSMGSGTAGDYVTVKYKPTGDTAWVRRYDGPVSAWDCARAIAVDDSGYVYVTGISFGSGTGGDYATIKYYPNGDTAWVRRYNGSGNAWDFARAIGVDSAGNVYVTGYSEGSNTLCDYATIKYYPSGEVALGWPKRYDGPGNDYDHARALAIDRMGNVYVTGDSWGGETAFDYATIKYDPSGSEIWVERYDGSANGVDYANAVAVDGSGNVYVVGQSTGSGTGFDYVSIKYYPNGDIASGWPKSYNGPGDWDDCASAVAVDRSGNAYVTGHSYGGGTWYDYLTIKYDSSGSEVWVRRDNGPGTYGDYACDIVLDDSGNVYVTGYSHGSGTEFDYATIKYSQGGSYVQEETGDREKPSEFALLQNYPNPFNQATKIRFAVAKAGFVSLNIYDILGRKVKVLVSERLSSGYKSVLWDGRNDSAEEVASGLYLYLLKTGDYEESKKMLLLK